MSIFRPASVFLLILIFFFVGSAAIAKPSDDVVRILVLSRASGPFSGSGGQGSLIAAEMAAEEVGFRAAGVPVEVLFRDSEFNPDNALQQLKQAHAEKPVDMVTGHLGTHIALPLQEFAEQNGIVIFHNGPSSTLFTGKFCSPVGVQWGYDTYASANNTIASLLEEGGKSWFLITADFVYGHDLSSQIRGALERHGGKVVGEALVPYPVDTVLPALEQARSSGADVVALSLGTEDMERAMREGYELGIAGEGIRLAAVEFFLNDIRRLGLYVTEGLRYSTSFYWNRTDRARAWATDFIGRMGAMPTGLQAGVYSATRHYLKAVDELGSDDAREVMAEMRRRPVNDGVFTSNGRIRQDGRMMHDILLVQVKSPSQSKQAWDYLDILRVTPADEAFRPMKEGGCRLVK